MRKFNEEEMNKIIKKVNEELFGNKGKVELTPNDKIWGKVYFETDTVVFSVELKNPA